jgi:hypothetical protein
MDGIEFEESFVVLRKAWTLPARICALEQFAEPVKRVSVSLTELVLVMVASEML